MNTTENNKIIAEFMGLKPIEVFGSFSISKDHVSVNCKNIDDAMNSFCKSTKYHSDWNWLMEVVEKIESLGFWTEFRTHKNFYRFVIGDYDFETKPTVNIASKLKIEAIYNACFEFVKWYNQQN